MRDFGISGLAELVRRASISVDSPLPDNKKSYDRNIIMDAAFANALPENAAHFVGE